MKLRATDAMITASAKANNLSALFNFLQMPIIE